MGQIGVLSTTLGDIWENVGDFSKNVGVFSKNVGDFRRIMPWYQGEIKTDERRECEGCESKKCKIAVGRAYVREEGVFHSATSGWWHLLCYPITILENGRKRIDKVWCRTTKRNRAREGRCILEYVTTPFWKVDLSNERFSKKICHFSVDFSHFRLISSHILIGGRGKERRTDE